MDGASDEGPWHAEVQFLWTEWHIKMEKVCTLAISRHSGGSYLNPAERQNGCLSHAHTNLFIPSTICGSNFNASGIDLEVKLTENLQTATSVFINRCNNAPAGDCSIKLYACKTEGHTTLFQDRRPYLLTFLKGTAADKGKLKTEKPDLYKYFCDVQVVQKRHMKKNLPSLYLSAFVLL